MLARGAASYGREPEVCHVEVVAVGMLEMPGLGRVTHEVNLVHGPGSVFFRT